MLSACGRWYSGEVTKGVDFVVIKMVGVMANQQWEVTEQVYSILKRGADPPGVTRTVPPGAWEVVLVSSRCSGKRTCATSCVAGQVRVGLAMGTRWGAR